MRCFFCKQPDTEVIETRVSEDGRVIRRRRHCSKCGKRFTTHERSEELPILVIKRDSRRERFDRAKLRNGILKAIGKTTVSAEQVEQIIADLENAITSLENAEIESQTIGRMVANKLKLFDKIAYIRFASVFRRFVDVDEFEKEIKTLNLKNQVASSKKPHE